jgi:ribonuclease HI
MSKKKFYVVWNGRKKGIYTSWNVCKKQIDGFESAQYKSFSNLNDAEVAFSKTYKDYKGISTKKSSLTLSEKKAYGSPNLESISVDAACSGNPGKWNTAEY